MLLAFPTCCICEIPHPTPRKISVCPCSQAIHGKQHNQKKKKKFEMDRAQTNVEGGESGDLQVTTHFMLYFISVKVSTNDFLD
ncbi:hypothetical protein, partial [Klebsiella pneumoniae]|uniref:hypothetical protein n=1 Tax=Klebsiella pneumoniae TaxID=573 RepID=UPI00210CC650